MIYSTTCAYAIRAMSRLAMIKPQGHMRISEICEGTDLPAHFVSKILSDLVRAGLLTSSRGRGGGYALARKPGLITLYDIVAAVDGESQFNKCVTCLSCCDDKQPCAQHEHFKPIRKTIIDYVRSTTLKDISEALVLKTHLPT